MSDLLAEIQTMRHALERAALEYHDLAAIGGPPVTAAMLAPLEKRLTAAAASFGVAIDNLRLHETHGSAFGYTADAWEAMRDRVTPYIHGQ